MADDERAQRDQERARRRGARGEWLRASLQRHNAILHDLAARVDTPAGWATLARHVASCQRTVDQWLAPMPASWYGDLSGDLAAHCQVLNRYRDLADAQLCQLSPEERAAAQRCAGLRIAVIGKGGAGKSVISATLARLLARKGRPVLAVDLDTNPGLGWSIGLGDTDPALPDGAVEPGEGSSYGWHLRPDLLPREAIAQFGVTAPDGVVVTGVRNIDTADKEGPKRTLVAVAQILAGFTEPGWDVVGDLEAGPTTPFENYHGFADHVVVVVGPAWRSGMTVRRLLPMIGEGRTTTIVANRYSGEPDHPGLVPDVRVPADDEVTDAERHGLAPLDVCPDSATIRAIDELAETLLALPHPTMSITMSTPAKMTEMTR